MSTGPRRWELTKPLSRRLSGAAIRRGESVCVREDKATEADVEAVAKLIAAMENGRPLDAEQLESLWAECNEEEKGEYCEEARTWLLSTIFKDANPQPKDGLADEGREAS